MRTAGILKKRIWGVAGLSLLIAVLIALCSPIYAIRHSIVVQFDGTPFEFQYIQRIESGHLQSRYGGDIAALTEASIHTVTTEEGRFAIYEGHITPQDLEVLLDTRSHVATLLIDDYCLSLLDSLNPDAGKACVSVFPETDCDYLYSIMNPEEGYAFYATTEVEDVGKQYLVDSGPVFNDFSYHQIVYIVIVECLFLCSVLPFVRKCALDSELIQLVQSIAPSYGETERAHARTQYTVFYRACNLSGPTGRLFLCVFWLAVPLKVQWEVALQLAVLVAYSTYYFFVLRRLAGYQRCYLNADFTQVLCRMESLFAPEFSSVFRRRGNPTGTFLEIVPAVKTLAFLGQPEQALILLDSAWNRMPHLRGTASYQYYLCRVCLLLMTGQKEPAEIAYWEFCRVKHSRPVGSGLLWRKRLSQRTVMALLHGLCMEEWSLVQSIADREIIRMKYPVDIVFLGLCRYYAARHLCAKEQAAAAVSLICRYAPQVAALLKEN